MKRIVAIIICLALATVFSLPFDATSSDSSVGNLADLQSSDYYIDVCTSFKDIKLKSYYHAGAHFCIEHRIMAGTGSETFSPNANVTRAMFVTMLYKIATSDMDKRPITISNRFEDVKSGRYYYNAVLWAVQNGITAGTDATHFSPNGILTREQLSLFLYRFAQYLNSVYENKDVFLRAPCRRIDVTTNGSLGKFPDASNTSKWAKSALIWAVNNGIISGTSESGTVYLRPKLNCSRAMAATIIYRFYIMDNVSFGPSFAKKQ